MQNGILRVLLLSLVLLGAASLVQAKVLRVYAGKLNINSASAADLTRLPGIGEVTASRIVKERERRGRFADPRELKGVKGVSERVYGNLHEYVAIQGESDLQVHIDLNTITKPLLLGLPGMSAGEAQSILNYRRANGRFSQVAELLKVPGIDQRRLQELSEWLTVVPPRR